MSDTTTVTSDAKSCASCGTAFGTDDDRRYKDCEPCRMGPTVEADVSPPGVSEPMIVDDPATEYEAITVDVALHAPPPRSERKFYLCGVMHDAPHGYYTMGGINFPKTEGELRTLHDGNQKCVPDVRDGTVHQLTEEQVALIKQHVASHVIRGYRVDERKGHTNYEGRSFSTSGHRTHAFIPQETDIPVGCFLYMVRVKGRTERPFATNEAPTMVQRQF